MPKPFLIFAALLFVSSGASAQDRSSVETAETQPVEVMILGSYHFANPGRDAVNFEADDMLAPRRQREMAILVDALAQWEPTRVLVESEGEAPHFRLPDYVDTESLLRTTRNESVQIGYRLARQLGHDAVYGFDERGGDNEPDYFPMGEMNAFAEANNQSWIIESVISGIEARVAAEQAQIADRSVAETLLFHNDPESVEDGHDEVYFAMMQVGDGDAQPGAELNAYWFMRNAKMFAKLMMIAEPGDRILAVVGSGHAGWLRDLARRTPGFELVESQPYVRAAAIASDLAED